MLFGLPTIHLLQIARGSGIYSVWGLRMIICLPAGRDLTNGPGYYFAADPCGFCALFLVQ